MTPKSKGVAITPEVLGVLQRATVENQTVFLPSGQLERRLYESVNKVLEALGGKWNRKERGHVFADHPADRLECALRSGYVQDDKKTYQVFPTPTHLALRMVQLARLSPYDRVLEPSAGAGAILKEIGNGLDKVAVELNHELVVGLLKLGLSGLHVIEADFMETTLNGFDAVIMNPPFSNGQDIRHIEHALTKLVPGGRLVAICGDGPKQNARLRPLVEANGGTWEVLPARTFEESGTGVNTVLLTMVKQ